MQPKQATERLVPGVGIFPGHYRIYKYYIQLPISRVFGVANSCPEYSNIPVGSSVKSSPRFSANLCISSVNFSISVK